MSRDLSLLHPQLRAIVPEILAECAAQDLPVLITQTFRTQAEQDALYAKGRTEPGQIVTNVRYPNSAHCWGVAMDFCRNVPGREYDDSDGFFEKVADIARPYGLTWGGDWKNFADKPHLELSSFMPGSSTAWLIRCYGTPQNFIASWKEEDMIRYQKIEDVPAAFLPTVRKLMERGILLGDGNENLAARIIDLSEDMVRILVYLDRAGVFDAGQDTHN